ncbi:MAG: ribose 5-phosphate isomerase A [Solirubrobacteraceae bacterium]
MNAAEMGKTSAAEQAAELVEDGMCLGLGTGSTVAYLLPALARRGLRLRCVATSSQTERAARELGLRVEPFEELDRLDIAIDGADQIAADVWLVKGGGGAHTREKIVAEAAKRFVVIASPEKRVAVARPPVPVEVLPFGIAATLRALAPAELRDGPFSPDGGLIGDTHAPFADARRRAQELDAMPGVVGHGLFAPELVSAVIIGGE